VGQNFLGLSGIADRELLRSGSEALAIGFPLDGPVHDATLMALVVSRRAEKVAEDHDYVTFLQRVQARYPAEYEALSAMLADKLTERGAECSAISPLLML
jgi:hypothetical protein